MDRPSRGKEQDIIEVTPKQVFVFAAQGPEGVRTGKPADRPRIQR